MEKALNHHVDKITQTVDTKNPLCLAMPDLV